MAGSAVVGALRVNLGLDSAAFSKGLQDAQKTMARFGKSMQTVGRSLSTFVTAPIAGFGVVATKEFTAFEKGLIGVGKTTNIAGKELEALGKGVSDISRTVPVATEELLGIAQAAGQLGVKGNENILRFTETIGKLGISSNLAGEEAATALARILTVTGTSIGDVDRLGSTIVRLGNNFAATEAEIAGAATRVAQSTAQFNATASEVAGIAAALTAVGVEAEAGGTVIGRAFQSISDAARTGGEDLETLARITGKSSDAIAELARQDPTAAFQALIEGLGRINAEGGDVTAALSSIGLDGVRVVQVLGTLATRSDVLADALSQANDEWEQNTALNREAATASEATAAQQQLMMNAFSEASRAIGQQMIPVLTTVLKELSALFQRISELSPAMLKWGTIVLGVAAALGPVLLGVGSFVVLMSALSVPVLAAVGSVAAIAAALAFFSGDAAAANESLRSLWTTVRDFAAQKIRIALGFDADEVPFPEIGRQVDALTEKIVAFEGGLKDGVVRGATAAARGMVDLMHTTNEWQASFEEWATTQATTIGERLAPAWNMLAETITGAASSGTEASAQMGSAMAESAERVWQALVDMKDRAVAALATFRDTVVQTFTDAVAGAVEAFVALPDRLVAAVVDMKDRVVAEFMAFREQAVQAVVETANGIVDAFRQIPERMAEVGREIMEGLWQGISERGEALAADVRELVRRVLPDSVERLLGIQSPSKVFHDIGVQTMEGLAQGLDAGATTAAASVGETVDRILAETERLQGGLPVQAREAGEGVRYEFQSMSTGLLDPLKNALADGELSFQSFSDALVSIGRRLADDLLDQAFRPIEDAIANLFSGAGSTGGSGSGLFSGLGSLLGGFFGGGGGTFAPLDLGFAGGFYADGGRIPSGGWGIVGEAGAELVKGPAQVFSNADTMRMLGNGGGDVKVENHYTFHGQPNKAEIRQMIEQGNAQTIAAIRETRRENPGFLR